MSVDLDRVVVRAPRYPEECPYWPCALFLYDGEEIVAALFFDDDEFSTAYGVDAEGVVDDEPLDATGHVFGWTLQILADTQPSPVDPRVAAPVVEGFGDDLTLPEVMERAYAVVAERATPLGLTFEQSRKRLRWEPEGGWPGQ